MVQASTAYGFDNRYAADSVEGHSDRLIGVCSVDFRASDAVGQIRHWVSERNSPESGSARPTAPPRCRGKPGSTTRSSIPSGPTLRSSAYRPASRCTPVTRACCCQSLTKFPGLVIALDHGARPRIEGGPPYAAADELFALAAYQGVFLKITSVTIQRADREPGGDARKLIRRLADGFGAGHLAWGSNFPASAGSLSDLRDTALAAISELTAEEQASFLSATAARIYPRLAD